MLSATILGIFFAPLLFVLLRGLSTRKPPAPAKAEQSA
jgi:hypothetical protein